MRSSTSGDAALKLVGLLIALPFLLGIVALIWAGFAFILMHTWNWFAATYHTPPITFWPAFGLVFLAHVLAGWLRPRSK